MANSRISAAEHHQHRSLAPSPSPPPLSLRHERMEPRGVGAPGCARAARSDQACGDAADCLPSVGLAGVAVGQNGDGDRERAPLEAGGLVDELAARASAPAALEEGAPVRAGNLGDAPRLPGDDRREESARVGEKLPRNEPVQPGEQSRLIGRGDLGVPPVPRDGEGPSSAPASPGARGRHRRPAGRRPSRRRCPRRGSSNRGEPGRPG